MTADSGFDPEAAARELRTAEQTATPRPLLTERFPGLTAQEARAVARARDELRLADGEVRIGYKLGWTSGAMRESFGIEEPNWGTLWDRQLVRGPIDRATLIHPKVEPELVFRCGSDLHGDVDAAQVDASGGRWALGLEVVDPRWPSYSFTWLDNTADNSSSARVAVGPFQRLGTDPAEVVVELVAPTSGHASRRSGSGDAAMGSPLEAVAWLDRSLAGEGTPLQPGEIVFTGGLTAPLDLEAGCTYAVTSDSLPSVSLETL